MYKLARLTGPDTRVEYDAMGAVNVPLDRMFGPQTMRAAMNFPIGGMEELMPVSSCCLLMESELMPALPNSVPLL